MTGVPALRLPNGCILKPGCSIRIPREQLGQIAEIDIELRNLQLLEQAASPGSEVIHWPLPPRPLSTLSRRERALAWSLGVGLPHVLGIVFVGTLINTSGWLGVIVGAGWGFAVARAHREAP